ncbi:MAG: CotH kinase family protein [Flavobacteriales bacterium]|nr:CotH kinase family protein [Flavobacteriales bacterium]
MATHRASTLLGAFLFLSIASAQVRINEGSSRNLRTIADENGEFHDWIELYNPSSEWVNLQGYSLTDDVNDPDRWTFPAMGIAPQGHLVVFCSGYDRLPRAGQTTVAAILGYTPVVGWNTHPFAAPFTWDGTSNVLVEICALNSAGTSLNASMQQTSTAFPSCTFTYTDSVAQACGQRIGNVSQKRPVVRLNGVTIGTNDWVNNNIQYPAPYGSWAGGSKHAMLFKASELAAAGLTAGDITSLAFNVTNTNGSSFTELDIRMGHVIEDHVTADFIPWYGAYQFHTNFGLSRGGETVFLFSPTQQLLSELYIEQEMPDHSSGAWPDGSDNAYLFDTPTPGASNNGSEPYAEYALTPDLLTPSTVSATAVSVDITNPNGGSSTVRYTLDGSEPTTTSPLFVQPLTINSTTVLRARAFMLGKLPSKIATASYLIQPEHHSPIISITTNDEDLNGPEGIFTRWWRDDEIAAYVDYFEEDGELLFSQRTGMQLDGGYGGSRTQPQRSFRLELDNGSLGAGAVDLPLIPSRPDRTRYSRLYLRNGSNQHLFLPHKDAAQVRMMAGATNSYYSAWTPVTVYINGSYFGLYELREKVDGEFFETRDGADPDSMDVLTVSSWSGPALKANVGSTDGFWEDVTTMRALNISDPGYWDALDQLFDLTWYTDYMIGQQWMGTTDWPLNNIKVYRSNTTGQRWRFSTTDLETAMAPNGQTSPEFNALIYTSSQDPEVPYTNIWQRSLLNPRYHDYYINRFADVMNSAYLDERIQGIAQECYDLTRPDMGDQLLRWRGSDTTALLNQFEAYNDAFMTDLALRTPVVRDDIQQFFSLPRQVDVTLNVHPAGAGKIRISTIEPETYPWEGVYFDGVPVGITAEAEPGYVFHHWQQNGLFADTLLAAFLDTLTTDAIAFDAFFEPVEIGIAENIVHAYTLYPNPAADVLHLVADRTFPGNTRFEIHDPRGELVASGVLRDNSADGIIDIGPLAEGAYQLRLYNGDHREALRFVKL